MSHRMPAQDVAGGRLIAVYDPFGTVPDRDRSNDAAVSGPLQ